MKNCEESPDRLRAMILNIPDHYQAIIFIVTDHIFVYSVFFFILGKTFCLPFIFSMPNSRLIGFTNLSNVNEMLDRIEKNETPKKEP